GRGPGLLPRLRGRSGGAAPALRERGLRLPGGSVRASRGEAPRRGIAPPALERLRHLPAEPRPGRQPRPRRAALRTRGPPRARRGDAGAAALAAAATALHGP